MTVIGDLQALTEQLNTPSAQNVTAEEKGLQDLATKCESLSKEVLGRLNKLKSDRPNSKWESFRIALDSMRSRGELESIMRQLDSYRSEISLRLTVMLKLVIERESERFYLHISFINCYFIAQNSQQLDGS